MLGINEIQELLPHRYPFLMVDRILELEEGRRIVGIKNVTINEPFFTGHFPGHPIMPGVLILEAMAQVGGVLLMRTLEAKAEKKLIYFTGVDKAKFRRPIHPGDQVRFELELLYRRDRHWRMKGQAFVEGRLVAEAELSSMVLDREEAAESTVQGSTGKGSGR